MTLEDITKRMKAARDRGELLEAIDLAQEGAALATDPDDIAQMRIDAAGAAGWFWGVCRLLLVPSASSAA
jgi:hypothetical protein